jgi:hypothetical protein
MLFAAVHESIPGAQRRNRILMADRRFRGRSGSAGRLDQLAR